MTTFTTAWMLAGVWGSGFVFGAVVASGRRRPRGNGNCEPMPPAPPYSSAAIAWRDAETQRDANDTARAKHAANVKLAPN